MANIKINISVDWEGHYLHNLQDFINLRNEYFRDIPLTHFICPNYFLTNRKHSQLSEIILPHDEVALHLHSWKPLVQAAGIQFKTEENYYNSYLKVFPKFIQKILVNGRGVPITVYNRDELSRLISFSKQLLEEKFNVPVKGFRAGGWIANKDVFQVLEEQNFIYDSSSVAPAILSQGYTAQNNGDMLDAYGDGNGIFTKQVLALWGSDKQSTGFLENEYRMQFFDRAIDINTQAFKLGSLWELPNNGGMSDFASTEAVFIKQIEHAQKLDQYTYISYGCHQEGNIEHKYAVLDNIKYINDNNIDVDYITNEEYLQGLE